MILVNKCVDMNQFGLAFSITFAAYSKEKIGVIRISQLLMNLELGRHNTFVIKMNVAYIAM